MCITGPGLTCPLRGRIALKSGQSDILSLPLSLPLLHLPKACYLSNMLCLPGCQHSTPITTTRTSPLIGLLTLLGSSHAMLRLRERRASKGANQHTLRSLGWLISSRIRPFQSVLAEALPFDPSGFNGDKMACSLLQSIRHSFLCVPPAFGHSALAACVCTSRKIKNIPRL